MNTTILASAKSGSTDRRRTLVVHKGSYIWPDGEFHLIYSHTDSEDPHLAGTVQKGEFGPLSLTPGRNESHRPHPGRSAGPGETWRFDTEFGYRSPTYEYVGRFTVTRRFYDPETGEGSVELHEVTPGLSETAARLAERISGLVTETGHTAADLARAMRCDVEEAEHLLNGNLEWTLKHLFATAVALDMKPSELPLDGLSALAW